MCVGFIRKEYGIGYVGDDGAGEDGCIDVPGGKELGELGVELFYQARHDSRFNVGVEVQEA